MPTQHLTVEWPADGGEALAYLDTINSRVTYLDRARPEDLANHDRRSLRVTEALLEEALTVVRDALHHRAVPPTKGTRS